MGAHQRRKGVEPAAEEAEEWRPVVGHEGFYEVSSLGRVRSVDRYVTGSPISGGRRFAPGRVLRPALTDGRPQVAIRGRSIRVLRLVAEAFLGAPPPGTGMVCHIDGDATNNRPGNLYWGNDQTNRADAIRHGTSGRGTGGKLTEEDVREIRALLAAMVRQHDIAARFGIHQVTVSEIKRRLIWGWLP